MPFTIKPLDPLQSIKGLGSTLDPSYKALAGYDYDPSRAWKQVSSSPSVRGTVSGGPSYSRFLDFGSEQQFLPIKPRPALTASALPDETSFYRRQLGAIEWDSINPYSTIDQVAGQLGQLTGEEANPLAFLRGAQDFLASKDVDIFGLGSTGAPARAADYALAFPLAIFAKISGQSSSQALRDLGSLGRSSLGDDDLYYKLHADPRYWQALVAAQPGDVDQLARAFASGFVDVGANSYVVEQLTAQLVRDRELALGLSSGNNAIDYRTIKGRGGYGGSPFEFARGLQNLPVVGTELMQALAPISDEDREAWAAMPIEERQAELGKWGVVQMGSDIISSLPAFGALGTVMQVARTGGTIARTAASGYDWLLRGSGWVMSAGLAAATTNWALSAVSPEYSEFLGKEIDAARPISGSVLAGAVNQLGYFASGTYGAFGLAKVGSRAIGSTAGKALGSTVARGIGHPETPLYTQGLGGALFADKAIAAGLHERTLKVSAQRLTMSYVNHLVRHPLVKMWDEITSGSPVPARPDLDNLPLEERILAANEELRGSLEASHYMAKQALEVLAVARRPAGLFQSEQARALTSWYQRQARTIDEDIAKLYFRDYGPAWVTREAGAYTEAAMETYVRSTMTRLGADADALGAIRGEDQWAKMMRLVHQYEFDVKNGELQAAMADAPGVPPTREAGRLSIVSSRHLFHDRADDLLAVLRGDNEALQRSAIDDLIDNTIEGERWFSDTWNPPKGEARDRAMVKPSQVIEWIEDVQAALLVRRGKPAAELDTAALPLNALHTRLADEGVWDLAFKPVNEAGEFVSYVKTRAGKAFQTPWLDYPMSNVDNIELGNRGIVMRKYDAIFRGFRTWRVAEFQRGLLFRNITGGSLGLDVTASQIDAFHAGILAAAGRHSIQPQTMGTVGQLTSLSGIGTAFHDEIAQLAHNVFGEGPYLTRAGEAITVNWLDVIARSYRQSLRLNLTAGLTSHLKSRLGGAGHAAAWWSDIGYVNLRFNLSPIFKVGEIEESLQLNAMAGVDPRGDPWVEALFYRAGVGEEHGVMMQEAQYDQMVQGLRPTTPEGRQARAYGWYALQAPETLAQKTAKEALQVRVEAHQQWVKGGNSVFASPRHALEVELADLVDDAGNILPGNEGRADEISRILAGELDRDAVRIRGQVGPELPDANWSTDPFDLTGAPAWIDEDLRPEDRGLWHATTNVDGVMESGLKSRAERIAAGERAVGLGHHRVDQAVSLTTSYDHASLIEARMRLATAAARNQVTGREIVDHFWEPYVTAFGEDAAIDRLADEVLGTPVLNDIVIGPKAAAGEPVGVKGYLTPSELAKYDELDALAGAATPASYDLRVGYTPDYLEAVIDQQFKGASKYRLVQNLDVRLAKTETDDLLHVGLTGRWEEILQVDPTKIGIVQVGFPKYASWKAGPDATEVQLPSKDVWTIDQRILDQELAPDKAGLLAQLRATLRDDGETVIPGFAAYHDRVVTALRELDGDRIVQTVDRLEDVPGSPEFLTETIRIQAPDLLRPGPIEKPGRALSLWETIKNPIPLKQHQATLYRIEKLRREFPLLIEAAGMDGLAEVLGRQLGIPERNWAPFLMADRELAAAFSASGHPDDLAALLAHSGDDARGVFDELYASEEWAALTGLWAIADRTAADDAFRVHFFNPYRSAFERSINHPLLGVYPASWAYKAARQWMTFLWDNHSIAGLRLGMAPAVALNHIVRAQNATFAQTNDDKLEDYIGLTGPFGSAFLIFNLILPGDWSSIPFPASRTIRDAVRGTLDARTLGDNISGLGVARDARLLLETGGELKDFVWGPEQQQGPAPWEPIIGPDSIRSQPFIRK